jgi:hypothetical protein
MLTTVYSVSFVGLCLLVTGISVSRPLVGLTFLVAVTPFYSILRESSTGSPVFFLWPYLLTGVLVLVITVRELARVLEERGVARPRRLVAMVTTGFIVAAVGIAEIWVGAVSLVLADSALSSTRVLLGNGPMGVATVVLTAGAALFFGLFLRAMYEREGRLLPLDLVMVAFVFWGVFQILNTYDRTGLLFTGLNGFRYYYFAAMTYFPARYLLRTEGDRTRLITVLGVVALVAGLELYGENFLLNVAAAEPSSLPWASGHLSAEFGYTPDTRRTFFEGRYIPLGFMYQTHVSGLFVALGFGLWLPLALSARDRPMLVGAVFALLFLMANSIWTSRTVLLLIGTSAVLAVALGRAGWRRSLVALVALPLAVPLTSSFLIPGVRYDVQGELAFLGGRALPSLVRAIGEDLEQVVGWNPMPTVSRITGYVLPWQRPPEGWQVISGDIRNDARLPGAGEEEQIIVALLPPGSSATVAELRFVLFDPQPLAGRVVSAEAWVWSEEPRQARLQFHDGTRGAVSNYHPGHGLWQRITVEFEVVPELEELLLDIDVEGSQPVYVDSVRLELGDAGVVLLGGSPDVTRAGVVAGLGLSATPSIVVMSPLMEGPGPPTRVPASAASRLEPDSAVTAASLEPAPASGPTNADLSAAVEVALALDPVTTALELTAIPDAGVIRIAGHTDTLDQQEHALRVAAAVPGVVQTFDNMTLGAQTVARIVREVEAALAAAPALAEVTFTVVVNDGVVTLTSDDTDATQRQLAIEIAEGVWSVTSVVDRMR